MKTREVGFADTDEKQDTEGGIQDLNVKQRQYLKGLAHSLEPVVMIGDNGITPGVVSEIERSLAAHELIKVRVFGDDRQAREEAIKLICAATSAKLVQHIGKLLVLYKANLKKKSRIVLPNK